MSPSGQRWQIGLGPGARRLSWRLRLKRWLVERAVRDPRIRRIALNRIFSGHGADGLLCLVPFDDHQVFVDPRDDRIAYSLLTGRAWQRRQLEAALEQAASAGRLPAGRVFVDVGANIGLMTIYAMLTGRFSAALAIEPDAWNRSILTRNLEINGLIDRVTVVAEAASDHQGVLPLNRDLRNFGSHSLEQGFALSPSAERAQVPVARLDDILDRAGIAHSDVGFVKIDVEGHEFAALAGMPELASHRPPLMIEVTFDRNSSSNRSTLVQRIAGYEHAMDLEQLPAQPIPLATFLPSARQHELLVY